MAKKRLIACGIESEEREVVVALRGDTASATIRISRRGASALAASLAEAARADGEPELECHLSGTLQVTS